MRGSESGAPCLSVAIGTVGFVGRLSVDGVMVDGTLHVPGTDPSAGHHVETREWHRR